VNNGGQAEISPACRAQLAARRTPLRLLVNPTRARCSTADAAGLSVVLRRRGATRNLHRNAVTVDVVATRGYDQLGRIDINEPRPPRQRHHRTSRTGRVRSQRYVDSRVGAECAFQRRAAVSVNPAFNFDSKALE